MLNYISCMWIIVWTLICKNPKVSSHSAEDIDCDPPWEKLHQTCVQFVKTKPFLTWLEARNACMSMNSDLLSINDKEENDKVVPLLKRHVKSVDTLNWWIGLRQIGNSWRWVDNDEGYARIPEWGPRAGRIVNPDDNSLYQGRCVFLNYKGLLTDVECAVEQKPYICEQLKKYKVPTEPPKTTTNKPKKEADEFLGCFAVHYETTCPPVEAFGISWPRAAPGKLVKVPCDKGEESKCSGNSCEELLAIIEKLEYRLEYTRELLEESIKKQVVPVPTPVCTQCPDTWIQYNGACYLFVAAKNTFGAAESHCLILGAHLVHIEHTIENSFIRNHVRTFKEKGYWIGLTDAATEGIFKWVDDMSTAAFTDWHRGQPNNGGGTEHCVHFRDTYNYSWYDEQCSTLYSSICKMKTMI